MENAETSEDRLKRIGELEADLSYRTEAWRSSLRLLSEAEERCTQLSRKIEELQRSAATPHAPTSGLTSDDWDDILRRSRASTAT